MISPDALDLARVLDLLTQLRTQSTFAGHALTLCNEVARLYRCEQAALGWLDGDHLRLQALDERLHFERDLDLVRRLESAMEECLEQDNELRFPAPADGPRRDLTDHAELARFIRSPHLLSVPFRDEAGPCGVLLLRRDTPFTPAELAGLRLLADHCAPALAAARLRSRWWGRRLTHHVGHWFRRQLQWEHPWPKLAAIALAVLLALGLFLRVDTTVTAPFILRAEHQAQLGAPFAGYVAAVAARVGDTVTVGQELLRFDTTELELQEAFLLAEIERYARDERDARHARNLPQMQIADTRRQQSEASLQRVRYQRAAARLTAPLAGTVIEDHDLPRRLGTAVNLGEPLLVVAPLDAFYAEISLREVDLPLIDPDRPGHVLFLSAPTTPLPFDRLELDPAAQASPQGNIVLARAHFSAPPPAWWRPGLSGAAELDSGRHSPLWILTHRAVAWLRYRLWW